MNTDAGQPRALYVHFPFCTHRCHYCDFSVRRSADPPVGPWLAAIARDLDDWAAHSAVRSPIKLDSVYVGGGTPSLLGADGMNRLREVLDKRVALSESVEFTAEANPISFDAGTARAWRAAGVTRVSLGVQSFADEPLKWLGRLHDAKGAAAAVEAALGAEFESVNVDMIFGLPAAIARDWEHEIRRVADLNVPHVSTYGLTAEPRTPLGRRVDRGQVRLAEEPAYEAEYLASAAALEGVGLRQYEVSNFALEGHESLHNWHYWERRSYLGAGPSAHSFLNPRRIWNVRSWDAYRSAAETGTTLREGSELLSPKQKRLEEIWLGLRTRRGLPRRDSAWAADGAPANLDQWREAGWLNEHEDRIVLTPAGWLRLDALVAELEMKI
ncbi:MAG: radical SAM family heme chaperone HemW [Gemmatimonadota bacterium]